jgi:hypothetical protein
MTGNRKLWPAVAVALVLTASAAPAAQAVPVFRAAEYPVTIQGTSEGTAKITLGAADDFSTVECSTSTLHGSLAAESTTLTLHPTFSGCKAFGFLEATVNTEECSFLLHATEKSATDVYRAHWDIPCPAGKSIKVSASTCRAEIKGQNGITSVEITDMTSANPPDVTMSFTSTEISYPVTQDGFLCPLTSTGAKTGATLTSSGPTTVPAVVPDGTFVKRRFEVAGE